MKIGVSISIDVTKIDKSKLFEGKKGKYLDMTSFIDLESKDQYDNNGFVAHSVSKEERDAGEKGEILGNVRVFYTDDQEAKVEQQPANETANEPAGFDDDIPF